MNSPGAILRRRRARPPRPGRRPLQLEILERRDLPTASLPGVLATTPADGTSVVQAPAALTITFDPAVVAQIDSMYSGLLGVTADQTLPGLFAFDNSQEIEIDRVNSNGTTTPIFGVSGTPTPAQSLTSTTLADGSVQAQMVVSLLTGTSSLAPGKYQVDFYNSANSQLASAFASFDPTSAWANATGPIPVATFTVTGQGPTMAGAPDLGTIGAQPQTVSSALAPGYYPSAVELYRFELTPGSTWQLNAQMLAQAIGSPVQGALALFDASGSVIATRRAGSGTSTGSIDPSLVLDLPGGTYYLGVSSAGDLPGTPSGYNPVSGMPGTGGLGQPAGSFRLAISATPVVATTVLTSSSILYADPAIAAPTGLNLTFSGPVNLASMQQPDHQQTALQVVDSSGRSWPITLASTDASGHLGFVFNEPLPPGNYSLIVPAQGGLTDLGGHPVAGPLSATPTLLATWTVSTATGPVNPTDLGVVWPGPENVTWNVGLSGTAPVAAGGSITDSFVAIVPGWYALSVRPSSATGTTDARIESATGSTLLNAGALTGPKTSYVYLAPGTYRMVFDSTAGPASIAWTLRPFAIDYEKLLENGVGQSATLAIPSFTPAPGPISMNGLLSSALPTPSPTPTTTPTEAPVASNGGATSSPAAGGTSGLAAGLLLVSLDAGLAGSPASTSSSTTPAAVAAPSSTGSSGGLAMSALLGRSSSSTTPDRAGDPSAAEAVSTTVTILTDDPATISARADAKALALVRDEPVTRIANWIAARLPGGGPATVESQAAPAVLDDTLLAAVDQAEANRDDRQTALARADLGIPFVVLIGTALTYRMARPIGKWWRRDRAETRLNPRPHRVQGRRMSTTKLGS